jgi:hypothetical protein
MSSVLAHMVTLDMHKASVLFTSLPQDGLVVNFYIPHNRRTPLQAEEALGPISIGKKSDWVKSGKIYLKLVSESLLLKNKWAFFPLVYWRELYLF